MGDARNSKPWIRPLDKPQNLENAIARTPISLLPTPVVNDMGAGKTVEKWDSWTAEMKARHGNSNGHGPSLSIEVRKLLPTPQAWDSARGPDLARVNRPNSGGMDLVTVTERLLPTPTARDYKDTGKNTNYQRQADRKLLAGVIMVQRSKDGDTSSDDPPPPQ
jgi:hypothetical protein